MMADLAYNHRDYEFAMISYGDLITITGTPSTKLHAQVHRLRSAQALGKLDVVTAEAGSALANSTIAPETANELRYYRAKAYLAQKRNEEAIGDLKKLATDTRNVYGAEAKYRLAQYLFDSGKTAEAEKEVLNYMEVSTPHAYWLARSFVLLSDIYVKLDRQLEARQYLLSLKQNYQADDDIAGMIESRLEKLNE
jgi:TolA-binding protein